MSNRTSLNRKKLGLIIGAAIVIVLAGLVALLLLLPEDTGDTTSSGTSSSEVVTLIEEDVENLESVVIRNTEDEYTIESVGESIWRIKAIQDFTPVASKYDSTLEDVCSLRANKMVVENCEDLSQFGFDEPTASMELTFTNGNTYALTVGDLSPDGTYRYVIWTGESTVYAVSKSNISCLELTRYDYLDTSIIPTYTDEEGNEVTPTVNSVTLTRPDLNEPVILKQVDNAELQEMGFASENSVATQSLVMTSPVNALISTTIYPNNDQNSAYDPIYDTFGLSGDAVVRANPSEEELAELGFDSPSATLEVHYNDSFSWTLIAGAGLDADGNPTDVAESIVSYYLMKEGLAEVFLVDAADIPWVTLNPKLLLSSVVTLPMINDVVKLEFAFDGGEVSDVLDITTIWTESDTSGGEPSSENTFTFNGEPVEDGNARQLYQLVLNPSIQDINWDREPTGAPKLTVQFTLVDDTVIRFDVYIEDDLTTIVSLNGNNAYIGRSGYVDKVKREVQNMRDNGAVEDSVSADW